MAAVLILARTAMPGPGRGKQPRVTGLDGTSWFASVAYVLIALVAVVPRLVKDVEVASRLSKWRPILLSALVLVAVNVAWFFMFDETKTD